MKLTIGLPVIIRGIRSTSIYAKYNGRKAIIICVDEDSDYPFDVRFDDGKKLAVSMNEIKLDRCRAKQLKQNK